jgi:hypothetical protein
LTLSFGQELVLIRGLSEVRGLDTNLSIERINFLLQRPRIAGYYSGHLPSKSIP